MDVDATRDLHVRIRAFQLKDLDAVIGVDQESFGKESYPVVALRQAYDLWGELFRVAESNDGQVLAYGIGATSCQHGGASWILALAVSRSARRQGIGTLLTREILRRLTKLGVNAVRVTVEPDNTAARKIYERLGFRVIQRVENYFGDRQDRLVMEIRYLDPK